MQDEEKPAEQPVETTPSEAPEAPSQTPETPEPRFQAVVATPENTKKSPWVMALILIAVLLVGAGAIWWAYNQFRGEPTNSVSVVGSSTPKADNVGQLTLDTTKNYGDKYADGILPVGDDKLVTDAPKTGYVYTCSQYAQNQNGGGADTRGPWFTNNNTEYDLNKKINVQGSKTWSASFSNKVSGDTRTIATNDLPDHHTGIFPILSSDPAYQYDRNPNSITGQTLTYALAASPTYSSTPHCMGGEAGVMLTGVALFNGFDAGARDAGAWEIQDDCSGHPQKDGEYHYHTLSSCITDTSVSKVIGFALDGFPITGPKLGPTNILTTSDLDECHGITSKVTLDGKQVTTYHYVMTQDFPYSISCFRGTPIDPPGQHSEGTSQQQSQQQGGQLPPPGQLPPR